jgi:acyl phosphate:glycerol-3-phosphate acyltransferase
MQRIIPGIIVSYLVGSIPTAYIFGRLLKGIDIRRFGSGNVGAANALRLLGRWPAMAVLLIDVFKGLIAVTFLADPLIANLGGISAQTLRIILGIACICGHNWTVFLKFKGGKGVAATLGVLLGLSLSIPGLKFVVAASIATWFLVFFITKIISASSAATALTLPIYMAFFKQPLALVLLGVFLSSFVILRHRANLKRLIQGKEPRATFKT